MVVAWLCAWHLLYACSCRWWMDGWMIRSPLLFQFTSSQVPPIHSFDSRFSYKNSTNLDPFFCLFALIFVCSLVYPPSRSWLEVVRPTITFDKQISKSASPKQKYEWYAIYFCRLCWGHLRSILHSFTSPSLPSLLFRHKCLHYDTKPFLQTTLDCTVFAICWLLLQTILVRCSMFLCFVRCWKWDDFFSALFYLLIDGSLASSRSFILFCVSSRSDRTCKYKQSFIIIFHISRANSLELVFVLSSSSSNRIHTSITTCIQSRNPSSSYHIIVHCVHNKMVVHKIKKNCTCVCHYANVASHSFWTCCVQYFGIPSPLGQTTTTTTNTITSHVTSHKAVAHLTATKRIPPNSRFSIVLRRTPHSLLMPCLFVGKSTYVRSTNYSQPYFTFSAAVINAGGMLSWNSSTFFLIVIHNFSSEKKKKRDWSSKMKKIVRKKGHLCTVARNESK